MITFPCVDNEQPWAWHRKQLVHPQCSQLFCDKHISCNPKNISLLHCDGGSAKDPNRFSDWVNRSKVE